MRELSDPSPTINPPARRSFFATNANFIEERFLDRCGAANRSEITATLGRPETVRAVSHCVSSNVDSLSRILRVSPRTPYSSGRGVPPPAARTASDLCGDRSGTDARSSIDASGPGIPTSSSGGAGPVASARHRRRASPGCSCQTPRKNVSAVPCPTDGRLPGHAPWASPRVCSPASRDARPRVGTLATGCDRCATRKSRRAA